MVRKNKLLIGCLTLLLVLSVGYALFSETITINGTATAKGSFDITTICTPGYSDESLDIIGEPFEVEGGYENSVCDVKDNIVTITTDLLYPTATRAFTIKMTNTGTVPALLWGATDYDTVESLDTYKYISWALKNKETDKIIKSGVEDISKKYDYISSYLISVISSTGEINSKENIIYDKNKGYAGIKLNSGDSILVIFEFHYPSEAVNKMSDNGLSEYFEFKVNHEFEWEQYTDSPNYESTTFDEWCFAGC